MSSSALQLLNKARQEISFNMEDLIPLIFKSKDHYQLHIKAQEIYNAIPEIQNNINFYNMGRRDQLKEALDRFKVFKNLVQLDNLDQVSTVGAYTQVLLPLLVQFLMVVSAIKVLGTDEQFQDWYQQIVETRVTACYAQTEIAHGSDVQGLETTAIYHKKTDTFIINSPTVASTKFWPGELGLFSNWALVYAQLIIEGKSYGPQPFMVPIRDMETHEPLPGVDVGDIGPKLGYATKDNGFLRLSQVSIPKKNLLSRYGEVINGQFKPKGSPKVVYASMMISRAFIIHIVPRDMMQSITIAIRYSIMREQFKNDDGKENSVMEYQTQQEKLLTRLVQCYGLVIGGIQIQKLVQDNFIRVQNQDFTLLQETHAILSGAKAYYTYFDNDCCYWCRVSCGGNGFANYSGLPQMTVEKTANVTLEGENTVIYLQLAKYLLKLYKSLHKNPKKIPKSFSFLFQIKQLEDGRLQQESEQELMQLPNLKYLLTQKVCCAYKKTMQIIQENIGMSFDNLLNKKACTYSLHYLFQAQQMVEVSDHYMDLHTFMMYEEALAENKKENIQVLLHNMMRLFAVDKILTKIEPLIEFDQITPQQIKVLKQIKMNLLLIIKKEAIGLVEAFQFSDGLLKTLIGCQNSDPYENMYKWASEENSMNIKNNFVRRGIEHIQEIKKLQAKL